MNWLPVLGLAIIVSAPNAKDAPKKAEPGIVGRWECVKFVEKGKELPADKLPEIGYEFAADGKVRARSGNSISEAKFTTDSTKDPAQLDFLYGKTAKKSQGIYKIEMDILTLCFEEGGAVRPMKFASPADGRLMLMTFRRVEKKKE